jgi:tetratricopeptide (TPR) repeat protein
LIQQLVGPTVSLLVTSREHLGWSGEVALEIGGLSSEEGANLFRLSAPQRENEVEMALAKELSQKLDGHPLCLRLLGGAFNASSVTLQTFLEEYDEQLLRAENKYVGAEHRHRTLYACIDTSVWYLDDELTDLLSKLWLFHAPFLPKTAVAIFDPEHDDMKDEDSPVYDQLYTLWRRGLLSRETFTVRDGSLEFYQLLPMMRPYVEQHLEQAYERKTLLKRFGTVYSQLANMLYHTLDSSPKAIVIARLAHKDLEQGVTNVLGLEQAYYLLYWARILQRLGRPRSGLELLEQALEIAQGQDWHLKLQVLNNMAVLYREIGQRQEALILHEQALPIIRELGDRRGEIATLINMAQVYQSTGQPQHAQILYEQALSNTREVGDRAAEAATLNNMAAVYVATRQPQLALEVFEQALPLTREVGDRAMEATTLANIADVLYRYLNRSEGAITTMEQAIAVLVETGLPQDAAGQTREDMQRYLDAMRQGVSFDAADTSANIMPSAQLQVIVSHTVVVMTKMQERRAEWREAITKALQQATNSNRQQDADFFAAVLAVLNGEAPALPGDHPYAPALAQIQEGIAAGGQ